MQKLKEIVNIQGFFVLNIGYVDMTTYAPIKYYYTNERVCFIYRLFALFISTMSFLLLLYTASWKYKSNYLRANKDFVLYYVLYY